VHAITSPSTDDSLNHDINGTAIPTDLRFIVVYGLVRNVAFSPTLQVVPSISLCCNEGAYLRLVSDCLLVTSISRRSTIGVGSCS